MAIGMPNQPASAWMRRAREGTVSPQRAAPTLPGLRSSIGTGGRLSRLATSRFSKDRCRWHLARFARRAALLRARLPDHHDCPVSPIGTALLTLRQADRTSSRCHSRSLCKQKAPPVGVVSRGHSPRQDGRQHSTARHIVGKRMGRSAHHHRKPESSNNGGTSCR